MDMTVNSNESKDPKYREMIDFLTALGTESIGHSGDKKYLAHLVSVFNDVRSWGGSQYLARAGMFHSIYGTQLFQGFTLPVERRDDLKKLIGEDAEFIAFLNCFVHREPFDQAVLEGSTDYVVHNRETGEQYQLTPQQWKDLIFLHLCDWMEQIERLHWWDYRREAWEAMSEYLGGVAKERYLETMGREPDRALGLHAEAPSSPS
ncbi:MAG: hypothetical protein CMM06_07040 [Rhodopirellula sp.]|nr:hypothetical protein [Rhodopirellula sp.]|tara:strand:- start:3793 stop:4407 length:615 start_codon:yes stop_codon:yes gene_type:complete